MQALNTSTVFIATVLAASAAAADKPPAPFDTAGIEELTGAKGKLDEKEGVFKVSLPRGDINATAAGVQHDAADGAHRVGGVHASGRAHDGDGRHRAARRPGEPGDERGARQRARGHRAAQSLLLGQPEGDVHAHRRHGRRGEARRRRRQGVREDQGDGGGKGEMPQRRHRPGEDARSTPGEDRRDARRTRASSRTASTRSSIGRTTKMGGHDDRQARWASTPGRPSPAATTRRSSTATSRCSNRSCKPCSRRCAPRGINIVAIHNHMTGESPRIMFLHYWGIGPTEDARPDAQVRARQDQARSRPRREQRRSQRSPAVAAARVRDPRGTCCGTSCAWAPSASAARSRSPATCSATWSRSGGWITKQDYVDGLALAQLAPGPLAAQLAIYLGWVAGGVLGATAVARRLHPALVRDGPGAVRALRPLRRPVLDAERVLRHRRGGHRDHRAQRAQAGEDDARQGPPAVGAVRRRARSSRPGRSPRSSGCSSACGRRRAGRRGRAGAARRPSPCCFRPACWPWSPAPRRPAPR